MVKYGRCTCKICFWNYFSVYKCTLLEHIWIRHKNVFTCMQISILSCVCVYIVFFCSYRCVHVYICLIVVVLIAYMCFGNRSESYACLCVCCVVVWVRISICVYVRVFACMNKYVCVCESYVRVCDCTCLKY